MLDNLCKFLSGFKMTVISMIFLLVAGICMVLKIKTPVDIASFTIIISGIPVIYKGFKMLFLNKKMTASLLITIAMFAAILTNEIFAAAEVAFIMALGGILEEITIKRARAGIQKLLNLSPKYARVIKDGKEELILSENVKVGDLVRVLAGEDIPVDGVVISGSTSINQSIITGESIPVDKNVGDIIYSGTTNCHGVIDIEVTFEYCDSSIQKLIKLIKEAEAKKAPTQRIVDKWASILIPLALVFALGVYFATGEILRAVTVLVVFCPCSLVLATPISIMAGIGHATKNGIIVKTGEALENMGKCGVFAFDKTGTITNGKLSVHSVETFCDMNVDEILYLTATTEQKSEHPIGKAIVEYALAKDFKLGITKDFKMFSGCGVYSKIDDKRIFVGNEKFMENNQIELNGEIKKAINLKRLDGKISLVVALDKTPIGMFSLVDSIREKAVGAINLLEDYETVLLTGDNSLTAEYAIKKTGIKSFYSSLLPKEKAELIQKMQKENKTVCMTGDGVNDALALKVADVGVSMGTFGSDIAIESSDIIITGDDLSKISYLKKLSNLCIKTIKTNIIISMTINAISLTLSALGFLNPLTGAIVHNIASIIVVGNAALLYEKKIN